MMAYPGRSQLAAYRSVAVHGGLDGADPHKLILMLMDGALERISAARGAIENNASEAKGRLLHRAVAIVDELRRVMYEHVLARENEARRRAEGDAFRASHQRRWVDLAECAIGWIQKPVEVDAEEHVALSLVETDLMIVFQL